MPKINLIAPTPGISVFNNHAEFNYLTKRYPNDWFSIRVFKGDLSYYDLYKVSGVSETVFNR